MWASFHVDMTFLWYMGGKFFHYKHQETIQFSLCRLPSGIALFLYESTIHTPNMIAGRLNTFLSNFLVIYFHLQYNCLFLPEHQGFLVFLPVQEKNIPILNEYYIYYSKYSSKYMEEKR